MTHLDPAQLVDLLEGDGTSTSTAHLESCAPCRAELSALQTALHTLQRTARPTGADDLPEFSPFYWEQFTRGVNERIDAPSRGWTDWIGRPRLAATLAAAALLFVMIIGARTLHIPFGTVRVPGAATTAIPGTEPSVPTEIAGSDDSRDDVEADAAWAVVRTAAQDLAYEDAEAEGISPRPGSAEIAVLQMSNDERAELARLLANELKRSGA